jgi:hypothetical protein
MNALQSGEILLRNPSSAPKVFVGTSHPEPDGPSKKGRQYCTQACLLGLARGGMLDGKCPNVSRHCLDTKSNRYAIDVETLVSLVQTLLEEDLDQIREPLGK